MRGQVTTFAEGAGGGTITGDNGEIYSFNPSSIRSAAPLEAGQRVDFIAFEKVATQIYVLDAPPTGQAASAGGGSVHGAFDLGRVIQRTFKAIGQNGVTFLIGAVLLVGLPSLAQVYGQSEMMRTESLAGFVMLGIGWVFGLVGTYVLQGMVVKITVAGFNGKAMSVGEAFEAGVKVFLPLLGVGIVAGLGILFGMILLVVPGIILAMMWSVATGVVVVENRGVMESLQRSRDLTRGHRWPILGLFVILFLISMVIGLVVGGVGAVTGGSFMAVSNNVVVNMFTTAMSSCLGAVLGAAGVAALYYELRSVKEGVGPEALASIFD